MVTSDKCWLYGTEFLLGASRDTCLVMQIRFPQFPPSGRQSIIHEAGVSQPVTSQEQIANCTNNIMAMKGMVTRLNRHCIEDMLQARLQGPLDRKLRQCRANCYNTHYRLKP
eukprot:3753247-Amphidinium_carterae.1